MLSYPALESLFLLALPARLLLLDALGGLLVRPQLLLVRLRVLARELGLTLKRKTETIDLMLSKGTSFISWAVDFL